MNDPPPEHIPTRPAAPVRLRDEVRILDLEAYAPFLVNALGGAWQRKTAADYRAGFDLGIAEWRVLAMLAVEPGITAARVCQVIRIDKSAASRSLSILHDKALARFEAESRDPRRRRWWLTEAGRRTHDAILDIALSHEARMRDGIGAEEFAVFLSVIRRMLDNLDPPG